MHTVMPPASRSVPLSTCWLSPMTVTVSLMSPNTRWLSCTSDSPAGVMRTLRPTRRKMLSFSSSSSSRICRLIADCDTCSFRPAPGERAGLGDRLDDLELAQIHLRGMISDFAYG